MNITVKQDGITTIVVLEGNIRFDTWEDAIKYIGEFVKLKK